MDGNKMQEKASQVVVKEAETNLEDEIPKPRSIWLNMLPLSAFLEFLCAILVVAGAAILVGCIDGHTQWGYHFNVDLYWKDFSWSMISPQTILSLSNSAASFLIALALKEGFDIAWWRKAMRGSTVGDLEKRYRAGNSLSSAILAGHSFGVIALATIAAAALGFTQGSLMQSSLSVKLSSQNSTVDITSRIATVLPDGYTGRITTHDWVASSFLTAEFNEVINQYKAASAIQPLGFSGCSGTCRATIKAAGLAPECTSVDKSTQIKIESHCPHGPDKQCSVIGAFQLFQSRFDYNSSEYSADPKSIIMRVSYVNTDAYETHKSYSQQNKTQILGYCPGRNLTQTCVLRPAIVEYPVIIQNNTVQANVIALDSTASPFFNVVAFTNVTWEDLGNSTIGGVQLALSELYQSILDVNYSPAGLYPPWSTYGSTGSLAGNSLNLTASGGTNMTDFLFSCKIGFVDPVPKLLAAVNEIMFRTALSAAATHPANTTIVQPATAPALQTQPVNRYIANYYYLGAAVGVTLLCVALMLPAFWGYWELDRKVSLNPIELADAFNAPVLRKGAEHRDLHQLMAEVGDRRVVWAPVTVRLADDTLVTRRAMVVPGQQRDGVVVD